MATNLDQQITQNVPEFFFIWDLAQQKIIHLTESLQNYARTSLNTKSAYQRMLEFIHPDHRDEFKAIIKSFSAHNAYQDHDLKVNHKKFQAEWLNLKSFPIDNDQGKAYRIVVHISDISRRKKKLASLEKVNERNEDIIRMLAHDLKNPLNNILTLTQLAEERIREGDVEAGLNFVRIIEQSDQNMRKLVDSMLELLELSGSHLAVNLSKTDFRSLVNNIADNFEPSFDANQVKLVRQLPSEEFFFNLDAQKFRHIINNLLSNALKFTPAEGEVTIALHREKQEKEAVLIVSDTGVGIAPKQQKEIFREFSRARRKGLRGEKSTGLGLSIVRKVVEMHQGTIKVESQPGRGTAFTIRLQQE